MFTMLADAAVKGFVLLAAIALLAIAVRRASAARRHLLWLSGVAGLLLLPWLSAVLPAWRVHHVPQWLAAESEDPTPPGTISPTGMPRSADALPASVARHAESLPDAPTGTPATHVAASTDTVSTPAPSRGPTNNRLASWSICLWVAAAVVAFLPTLLGLWQISRVRRTATPLRDDAGRGVLDEVSRAMGLRRPVRLLSSPTVAMPLTFGAWRPTLLVPTDADTWSVDRWRLVARHELAHIRRGDWLTQLLAQAACALHWFNPLAWLAARQMQLLREQACDDLVLAGGARASDYARELLAIASRRQERPFLALAAVPMALRSALEGRLRAVLDIRRNRTALTATSTLLAMLLLAAGLIPLAMLQAAGPKPLSGSTAVNATLEPGQAEEPAPPRDPPPGELPGRTEEIGQRGPSAEISADPEPQDTSVTVRGQAVDDETGQPVASLIVQAGKFDPADPTKVTWGYSEQRSSARDGSFSTTVRWTEGWTARILADGYLPQPVLHAAPPAGKREIEVLVRLKRGRIVRGQVLDSKDQPVQGAAVFAILPTGLNLADGKAWTSWGAEDTVPRPAVTDRRGRFELPGGDAQRLAVSCHQMDAWPAAIAEQGDTIIHLPAAARVDIELNIEGAAEESEIFFQLLGHLTPRFERLRCEHTRKIRNGGVLTLPALPPGKYQFCRQVTNRLGEIGFGAMLERQLLELKAGETRTISYVRPKGSRLRGKVTGPAGIHLMGIVVKVESQTAVKGPFDNHAWTTTYASQTADEDGGFLTERIAPGTYMLVAEAYVELTPEQRVQTGFIRPTYRALTKIEVPDDGELTVPDLKLEPIR